MVVSYAIEDDSFRVEKTRRGGSRSEAMPRQPTYSLHPDGQRVAIAAVPESTAPQNTAVFVFNFFDELRRRAR